MRHFATRQSSTPWAPQISQRLETIFFLNFDGGGPKARVFPGAYVFRLSIAHAVIRSRIRRAVGSIWLLIKGELRGRPLVSTCRGSCTCSRVQSWVWRISFENERRLPADCNLRLEAEVWGRVL